MIEVILTDIEGTTSPIEVVTRQLFPYARARLRPFVRANAGDPEIGRAWEEARTASSMPLLDVEELATCLEKWSDEDRKIGPLKAIQGLIWDRGFLAGELRGVVYPDVAPALSEWRARGLRLAVFSSGSVRAQRGFFAHCEGGDLAWLFEAHFDTSTGAKASDEAYRRIARSLGVPPERVLFLSDVAAELEAARAAGMHAIGIDRGGAGALDAYARAGGTVAERFDVLDVSADPPRLAEAGDGTLGRRLCALARTCDARGWVRATSGNFSARLSPDRALVTASGLDKGKLEPKDLVVVDVGGGASEFGKPSAETPLHCALYRSRPDVGAIAHTHSVAATVLSRSSAARGVLELSGYEMAKALPSVITHEETLRIPVVANDQDTRALAEVVARRLHEEPRAPAYLVAGHGMTVWGKDLEALLHHVEAMEFLLACELEARRHV